MLQKASMATGSVSSMIGIEVDIAFLAGMAHHKEI